MGLHSGAYPAKLSTWLTGCCRRGDLCGHRGDNVNKTHLCASKRENEQCTTNTSVFQNCTVLIVTIIHTRSSQAVGKSSCVCWHCLTQPDAVWHSLIMSDTVWSCLTQPDAVRHSLTMSDTAWTCQTQPNNVWHSLNMSDTAWQCLTQPEAVWHSLIMSDTAWQCLTHAPRLQCAGGLAQRLHWSTQSL